MESDDVAPDDVSLGDTSSHDMSSDDMSLIGPCNIKALGLTLRMGQVIKYKGPISGPCI